MRRAIFLDRDGTLVYPRSYPSRPKDLILYPGVGQELARLQAAGFRLIVITNQSGIARGYFSEEALTAMHTHLASELAQAGVRLDAVYHCPHHPDGAIPPLAIRCDCRKPQPGMLLHAAADHTIDLSASWMIGDILDDIEAGKRAGCRAILVDLGTEQPPTAQQTYWRRPTYIARSTIHALQIVQALEGIHPTPEEVDLAYQPDAWRRGHVASASASSARPKLAKERP